MIKLGQFMLNLWELT